MHDVVEGRLKRFRLARRGFFFVLQEPFNLEKRREEKKRKREKKIHSYKFPSISFTSPRSR